MRRCDRQFSDFLEGGENIGEGRFYVDRTKYPAGIFWPKEKSCHGFSNVFQCYSLTRSPLVAPGSADFVLSFSPSVISQMADQASYHMTTYHMTTWHMDESMKNTRPFSGVWCGVIGTPPHRWVCLVIII